jgi:N-acetylmuramoyl-L-alanine amidase CwlA
MTPTTITIHNTGNPTSTARNERNWLTNPSNDRQASFHIVVDEKEAIECIPLNEVAWHAGDGRKSGGGNMASIGIEICESGNYEQTLQIAADLAAKLLKERGWGVDRLRRHYDWSGKICPRLMYDGGKWTGWYRFVQMVDERLKPKVEENPKEEKPMQLSEWQLQAAKQAIDDLAKRGLIDSPDQWKQKLEQGKVMDDMPWLFFVMMERIADYATVKKGVIV